MCISWRFTAFLLVFGAFFYMNETVQPHNTNNNNRRAQQTSLDGLIYPGDYDFHSGVNIPSNQYQQGQHNHPEDEDYDDRLEQKPSSNLKISDSKHQNKSQIPLSLIKEINDKGYTVNDLLLHYVDDYEYDFLESRFGEDEKGGAKVASEAGCMPEFRTVRLVENSDPSTMYIPACTRIEQCGGCCKSEMLECQPVEVETVNFKILKASYKGDNKFSYDGKEIVSMDRHKECKCKCKVKPENCSPMQVYEESSCKCICRNKDEEKKCFKENSTKLWNPDNCTCQCRKVLPCTTGSVFDTRQCKCIVKQVRRRNVEQVRKGNFGYYPMPVIPLRDPY